MYTPHVGRWLSEDPAGFVDGQNRYLYVRNNPANWTDPSGLCVVCGGAGIRYRVGIAALDAFTKHGAYRRLADFAADRYNTARWQQYGFDRPELDSAGPYTQLSKELPGVAAAGIQKLAFFLFFVDWDVCEADGKCRLFLDETGSTTTWKTHGRPPKVIARGKDLGELNVERQDWTTDDRNPPIGVCNTTLIYADAPGWKANRNVVLIDGPDEEHRWGGFVTHVKQTLQIKDKDGNVLSTVRHEVKISVDENLNATFSP